MDRATLTVTRADGSIEVDQESDAYGILCAKAQGLVRSLANLDGRRVHTRHVAALIVQAPRAAGSLQATTTLAIPSDPELAGGMLFAALMSVRTHNPGALAALVRRLEDAGFTNPTGALSP